MKPNFNGETPVIYKVAAILSIISVMAGTLTCIMTLVNLGYGPLFIKNWLSSFALAVCILVPAGYLVMSIVNLLVERLFSALPPLKKNILAGVFMAIVMESIMAVSTAANTIGFTDLNVFFQAVFDGFITALPVGLVLSLVMTLTIKPKLEQFMAS